VELCVKTKATSVENNWQREFFAPIMPHSQGTSKFYNITVLVFKRKNSDTAIPAQFLFVSAQFILITEAEK
jgi:hypothetical protein